MVVNPMVVASAGFAHEQPVVGESMVGKPLLGNHSVFFSAAREKGNEVSFGVPRFNRFKRVRVNVGGRHALWFLVRNIVANGSVNVDEVVFYMLWQHGAYHLTVNDSLLKLVHELIQFPRSAWG
jgi:hypothetical protein